MEFTVLGLFCVTLISCFLFLIVFSQNQLGDPRVVSSHNAKDFGIQPVPQFSVDCPLDIVPSVKSVHNTDPVGAGIGLVHLCFYSLYGLIHSQTVDVHINIRLLSHLIIPFILRN